MEHGKRETILHAFIQMKAPCVFRIETGELAWVSLDECFCYEARFAGWHMEKNRTYQCEPLSLTLSLTVPMYGRTNVAIVAVWCALFSDRKCCFGVDCFRMDVAVAIQMCCEHDTQTIRFRLDSIVKILYNKKVNCLFWTGQTFHLQILKTEIENCTKLQIFGFIRAH